MSITVQNVLENDGFDNVDVLAGSQGLTREVKSVYIMEVPDIFSYIEEGGLLFTTLFPIAHDEEALKNFIPRLHEEGLAGAAIKFGRYVSTVPSYMLEQADRLGFPILALPSDANLSDLTNDVLTMLLEMRTSQLELREAISEQLHAFLLDGRDLSQFVDYLARFTGKTTVVLDNSFNLVHSFIQLRDDWKNMDRTLLEKIVYTSLQTGLNGKRMEEADRLFTEDRTFVQRIEAGNRVLGYLIFLLEADEEVTETLTIIGEQAIILLAFLLQTKQNLIQQERSYFYSFIRAILEGQYQSQIEIIEKAKVFKWNLNFPNVLMLVKVHEKDEAVRLKRYDQILSADIIPRVVGEVFDIPEQSCKTTYFNDGILCFISLAFESQVEERLDISGKQIVRQLEKYGKIAVSTSETIYRIDELKKAFDQTVLIHDIFENAGQQESYVQLYSRLGLYKLFHLIPDQNEIEAFVQSKIGEVLAYDEKKDTNLLETLECLIKNKGNVQKTAEDLFIHYNSLRYRIGKLKELNVELEDGNRFVEVAVACQMHRYLNR